MKRVTPWIALAISLGVSGCGPSLGEYKVTEVSVVDALPESAFEGGSTGHYLSIALASDFDLVAEGNGNIYASKIACGGLEREQGMVPGPLAAGDPPIDLYEAEPAMKRDEAGRAHYLIFVPVSAKRRKPIANIEEYDPAYDLRQDADDLCLKITQAGYFITESRSQTIHINAAAIAAALGS